MGTIGGKVGFGAAVAIAFILAEPMVRVVLGPCFFEEGCGESESMMLLLPGIATLALAAAAGLLIRMLVNRLLQRG